MASAKSLLRRSKPGQGEAIFLVAIDSAYDTRSDHDRNSDEQTRGNNWITAAMANPNATEINGMTL